MAKRSGVICRNALGLGRRCISIFATGETTVRSTELDAGVLAHLNELGKAERPPLGDTY